MDDLRRDLAAAEAQRALLQADRDFYRKRAEVLVDLLGDALRSRTITPGAAYTVFVRTV